MNIANYIQHYNIIIATAIDKPLELLSIADIQCYFANNCTMFQAFTRKYDNNGNGFCLILAYMTDKTTVAFSANSSNPNCLSMFRLCYQCPTIYVAPQEYKDLKKSADIIIETI